MGPPGLQIVAVVLTCITIILTHSRGGFLSMSAGLFLIAFRSGNCWSRRGSRWASPHCSSSTSRRSRCSIDSPRSNDAADGNEDSSVAGRFRAWKIGARMIEHNPIVGVGHKNFRDHYQRHA